MGGIVVVFFFIDGNFFLFLMDFATIGIVVATIGIA